MEILVSTPVYYNNFLLKPTWVYHYHYYHYHGLHMVAKFCTFFKPNPAVSCKNDDTSPHLVLERLNRHLIQSYYLPLHRHYSQNRCLCLDLLLSLHFLRPLSHVVFYWRSPYWNFSGSFKQFVSFRSHFTSKIPFYFQYILFLHGSLFLKYMNKYDKVTKMPF